ncbi:MAG: alpha/beta fold hydrolase [Deltaproteobacteria bacterium]|nr:alpha/beta fold hydrolase [Deltaproteobacteria bacterium]
MPFAPINGIDLYYETHGSGPALVFAHGGGGSHLSWWQQVPVFAKQYTVVTFDHRSFGHSRDLPNGPGPNAFVQDLTALLDHLKIEKAVVAGQSMGGWTVCGFAAAHPERTRALILCDTTGGIATAAADKSHVQIRERSRGTLAQVLENAYAKSFPERAPAMTFLYRQISALNTHVPPTLVSTLFGLHHQVKPIVDHKIPTLLLVGEDDVLTPPAAMRSLVEQLPHARFVQMPQAGHSAYFECADEYNRIVGEFLREIAN